MSRAHLGEDRAESIRLAVVGYGRWGTNVARDMAACTEVRLTHVVDIDDEALGRGGCAFPKAALETDLSRSLQGVDAVAVCTPARHHFEHAAAALSAGKHVFLEKPMAMTLREAQALAGLASQRNLVLVVGHQMLHHGLFKELCSRAKDANPAEVKVTAHRAGLIDLETEPDVLWAYGPHDLAMIFRLLGEKPERWKVQDLNRRREDGAVLHIVFQLEFSCGAAGRVELDCRTELKERRIELERKGRRLLFDDVPAGGTLEEFDIRAGGAPYTTEGADFEAPLRAECMDFVRRVKDGLPDEEAIRLSVEVTRILEQISDSISE